MEYFTFIFIAIVSMIALSYTEEREVVRVDWSKIASFVGFMTLVSFLRIASYDLMLSMGAIKDLPTLPMEIAMNKWTLCLVFWEDMFFGLPLYLVHKYMNEGWMKWLKWPITVLVSLMFGLGHIYQGIFAVFVTSLYPYFISKKYGERHGFGTVMMCHIIYDNMTTYMIILLPYLLR